MKEKNFEKVKKNSLVITLLMSFMALNSANVLAQQNQSQILTNNEDMLKKAGINIGNSFNIPGGAERTNTIRSPGVVNTINMNGGGISAVSSGTTSAGKMPSNAQIQGDDDDQPRAVTLPAPAPSQQPQQNKPVQNGQKDFSPKLTELNQVGKDSLNKIGIQGKNGAQGQEKKQFAPSIKATGPTVQKVDISHFNQGTIKEMEAYGNSKGQEEYLKFRIEAEKHKNPPIQIKRP